MNKIIFPLKPRMKGPEIADLQTALRFLLDKAAILSNDPPSRRTLSAELLRELSTQTYGTVTQKTVSAFQQETHLEITGSVDQKTANALNDLIGSLNASNVDTTPYIVQGTVRKHGGDFVTGVFVTAFDRDLRNEQPLGKIETDRRGFYRIEYTSRQFLQAEKDNADLIVKAFSADGALLVASSIQFNAPPIAKIDLTLPEGVLEPATLFEKLQSVLPVLLGDVEVAELEEDAKHQDLTFLTGETGFEKPTLARFALAHRLVQEGMQAEFWFALLGGSLFQFNEAQSLTEQLPDFLEALQSLDAVAIRKAMNRAINQKEIAEKFRENIVGWIKDFLKLIARRSVKPSDKPSLVKLALDDAKITEPKKQETFARLYNEYKTLTPELLDALEKDTSFNEAEVADLRTSFELSELTQADFSVVKMLKNEFGVRQPEKIRTLAKNSEIQWIKLVTAKHAAGDIKLPTQVRGIDDQLKLPEAEIYGKTLARQLREAFPTTAFAGGLERAMQNGGAKGFGRADVLHRFLDGHENFELLNTPIDDFLRNDAQPEFRRLASDDGFRREIKAVQRVFKLVPTFEATDALLADGVHSAQKVYRMGQSEFVRRYAGRSGFTPESATLAWNRAADTHAAVLTIVADLKGLEADALPMVLKNNDQALSQFPNWNNLFRTGDLCECEHCRSVLSPAAYFADLLLFLKDRDSRTGNGTAKDVLFGRRSDLGFIELNCTNALTPLPYIDVVCEVLEAAIDENGNNDLELTGFTIMPADSAARTAVTQAISAALVDDTDDSVNENKQKIGLGANFTLSQVTPSNPDEWVVHGDDVTYRLKKKTPSPNFFAEILRNTKAGAAELRAYPQYVNPQVYSLLTEQRFPLSLPFDLFAEEVRAGFQKTNLQRWDLMRTLRGTALPNNATDADIAAEYFGISTNSEAVIDERRLIFITDATVAGQQAMWGETGADWLNIVGNVKNFLQKTSLEYNELLALLDLPFINPGGDIVIHHLDASCDTDQKVIQVLNPQRLDRIHRFLRLWRKLKNWAMWELDLVFRQIQIGNGVLDEAFLLQLFYFSQLRSRLGSKLSIEQVCALFGDLNVETRFTRLHEKREDALYQNLFLNRRLINPLDLSFQLDRVTVDDPTESIVDPAHLSVVLAALGLSETDLMIFLELTRASNGSLYIAEPVLSLSNLSFLWRHAWLAKQLKFKADEWRLVLKLFQQDLTQFTNPQAAWEFVERIDHLKACGFSPDELNWLLAADRTAKSALQESDAARFLSALRKELQTIQAEYNADDMQRFPFLNVPVPTDTDSLFSLLTSLLQKLNRDEKQSNSFLRTMRGGVVLESAVQGMPDGFVFPAAITSAPNHIPIEYDQAREILRVVGIISDAQRSVLIGNVLPVSVTQNASYLAGIDDLVMQSLAIVDHYVTSEVEVELDGGVVIPADRPSLPIRYNASNRKLSFIGVMTDAERLALNAAGNPAIAIDELFRLPRLAVKFFEPIFTVPLAALPSSIDFKAQLAAELSNKIFYDSEQQLLRFTGIMNAAEQSALNELVGNEHTSEVAYHTAINSLAGQPQAITSPDSRIWVTEENLEQSNGTLALRMAGIVRQALNYLSKTLTANAVVQQSSAQLGLTEALTRRLLDGFAIMPPIAPDPSAVTLLAHLIRSFAATGLVVDYAAQKTTFDGWFWANRVAIVLKKWKITFADLENLTRLTTGAQLLDFTTLPMDADGAIASIAPFLRTSRLLRFRDSLPETQITFLEVLEKLNIGEYAAAAAADLDATEQGLFAEDVELMNEAWSAAQLEALINTLDLAFPGDYLVMETWERLRRAFYYQENLNSGVANAARFAEPTMRPEHAKTLKELLRSKFGEETWLALSAEIQDILRERKRDALAAYLLNHTHPQPDDIPSGKWENVNDLYAYYLLDIEMSSCQLTSRLVQGSGSIQLFVQRCFMGLEPHVLVQADGTDGDSTWRWWKWMRKYRVWEANRKVFLWPENWIEPELKKDRSSFFKDLENALLQNEINQATVETAYINYLEKLDVVAQLEVAGFYQEDDGDNTVVHVFGRTKGAEPHLYYYRRYDYRQWTPWEKVDLDIQGDYLIPAVINKRLFLFWPVFTEVPDEEENSTVTIPAAPPEGESGSFTPDKTQKKLKLQMAVSDFRQGKWTPKRISIDFAQSDMYWDEIIKKHYQFVAIDGTEIDGRFVVKFGGFSATNRPNQAFAIFRFSPFSDAFEMDGCRGVPELTSHHQAFYHISRPEYDSVGEPPTFHKWVELNNRFDGEQDFATAFTIGNPVLRQTPGIFTMSPSWQLSYFDRLILDGLTAVSSQSSVAPIKPPFTIGSWLPFFYNDRRRTFFVLPAYRLRATRNNRTSSQSLITYYPEIKKVTRELEANYQNVVRNDVNNAISGLNALQRGQWEQFLKQQLGDLIPSLNEVPPSYTDEQFAEYATRWIMRPYHLFLGNLALWFYKFRVFHFKNFYHPFVCDFAKLVYNPLKGIPGLLSRETQLKDTGFRFRQFYQPTPLVIRPGTEEFYPKEDVDFTPDGAYSSYNWELFFHAPLLIANSLSKNQRFEEARDWYHFIFNPIGVEATEGGSPMSKYWITKPFFQTTNSDYVQQRIENILRMLAGDSSIQGTATKDDLEMQVEDWRTNPFEPHRIANYRTVAYQKTVVMKYLDNLIAWGDYLFRQDSMESINEATQLYVLAAEILGPRPKKVPPQSRPAVESFNELETQIDAFGNALVEVENAMPVLPGNGPDGADQAPLPMLYFCIPQNDKLLGYWDTVADRHYKIRHCMNIEGVVRQLALFEPPIDPAALVKAVAGGMDISSALADLNAPLPHYRFNILLQKANELCNDVKALGGALLSALEKKDAETMSLLRQGQEIRVLEAVKIIREKQIEEAKENLEGLKRSKLTAEARRNYYRDIEKLIAQESLHLDKMSAAHNLQEAAQGVKLSASIISILPAIDLGVSGFGGTPIAKFKIGGLELGQAADLASDVLSFLSMMASNDSAMASSKAGFERRWDDWKLQELLANKEIEQIDKSISAAELRKSIAEKELENHALQIENAKAVNEFMSSKYTNEELYQWQIGQISGVYFQSYQLAYDLAKRAERCFRFELGLQDSSYINFGYWDSLKKGLLCGEKLQYDLRRLETAYLEQNRREFELTKHVSLALLDPFALIRLRETGRCFFSLPEEIFDLDYPGHYFRRIKSVSITLPCVLGPYTTISCTLRLLKNSVRINTTNGDDGYPRNTSDGLPTDDSRFIENNIPVKSIAASSAQNDSGVFELSFRDERYLPFEGAGAISDWSLELFNDLPSNNPDPGNPDFGRSLRQFDYGTISDAILHIKYTAREDAGVFKNSAITHLRNYFSDEDTEPQLRMFNLQQDFPTQWYRFLNPANPENGNVFELELSPNLFPIRDKDQNLRINTISLLARSPNTDGYQCMITGPDGPLPTITITPINQFGGLHFGQINVDIGIDLMDDPITWQLRMTRGGTDNELLQINEVENMILLLGYRRI